MANDDGVLEVMDQSYEKCEYIKMRQFLILILRRTNQDNDSNKLSLKREFFSFIILTLFNFNQCSLIFFYFIKPIPKAIDNILNRFNKIFLNAFFYFSNEFVYIIE